MTLTRTLAAAIAIAALTSASAVAQQQPAAPQPPNVYTLDQEQMVTLHHALDMAERHMAARSLASPVGEDGFMVALARRELFRLKQTIGAQEQAAADQRSKESNAAKKDGDDVQADGKPRPPTKPLDAPAQ